MKRAFSDDSARPSPMMRGILIKRRRFSHVRPGGDEDDDTPRAREDLSRRGISERLIEAHGGLYHGIYRALVKRDLPRDVEIIRAKLLSPLTDEHIGDDGYPTPELVRRAIEYYAFRARYARNDHYYDTVFNPEP